MDLASGFKQTFSRAHDSNDYVSEASSSAMLTESDVPDYGDLIGAEEVEKKGDPVKGRRYLFFNVFMIIILSIWVVANTDKKTF